MRSGSSSARVHDLHAPPLVGILDRVDRQVLLSLQRRDAAARNDALLEAVRVQARILDELGAPLSRAGV